MSTSQTPSRPYVVVHVAVSLDGCTTGFPADVGRFYSLLPTWREDVTLTGAETVLTQEQALASAPRPGPTSGAPLLAVVDSRRRIREWEALRDCGYWSGVLALRAGSTPSDEGMSVPELAAGSERVDLVEVLSRLSSQVGARVVRVDSGGGLTGVLLQRGLVDEVSLLIHPCFTSAAEPHRWYGSEPAPSAQLTVLAVEMLEPNLVWLRYRAGGRAPDQ